jgi:thiol-disulfide isomerase/thioredoxin
MLRCRLPLVALVILASLVGTQHTAGAKSNGRQQQRKSDGNKASNCPESDFFPRGGGVKALCDAHYPRGGDARGGNNWFVMFFAPWCGHCQRLHPTFSDLAESAAGWARFGAIDCTHKDAASVCRENGVSGYPTLKLVKPDGTVEDYRGPRDLPQLMAFLHNHVEAVGNNQLGKKKRERRQKQRQEEEEEEEQGGGGGNDDAAADADEDDGQKRQQRGGAGGAGGAGGGGGGGGGGSAAARRRQLEKKCKDTAWFYSSPKQHHVYNLCAEFFPPAATAPGPMLDGGRGRDM